MTKRIFWFGILTSSLFVGAALPAFSGCATTKSCVDLCAEREACPGVTPAGETCEVQCKNQEVFTKAAACETQEQEWNDCLSPLESVCNAAYDCATEALARDKCYTLYCGKNPTTTGCEPYTN